MWSGKLVISSVKLVGSYGFCKIESDDNPVLSCLYYSRSKKRTLLLVLPACWRRHTIFAVENKVEQCGIDDFRLDQRQRLFNADVIGVSGGQPVIKYLPWLKNLSKP